MQGEEFQSTNTSALAKSRATTCFTFQFNRNFSKSRTVLSELIEAVDFLSAHKNISLKPEVNTIFDLLLEPSGAVKIWGVILSTLTHVDKYNTTLVTSS